MQCTAVYQKQGAWYLGWVEEVPGVNTQGKTMVEAKANLKEALQLVLEANKALIEG
jgi:predicted RNase H-like HicB family nuclease